ncbi:hypothetical protein L9F63_026320, partial [Diploptera punctata]
MTFLGLEARTDLPKVPYPTALDFFVFLSFAFIFATIIQFAVVHYFTKYGSGECYFSSDFSSDSSSDEDDWNVPIRRINDTSKAKCIMERSIPRKASSCSAGSNTRLVEVIPLSACSVIPIGGHRHQPWSMQS